MALSVLMYAYGADLLITGLVVLATIEGASVMYHLFRKSSGGAFSYETQHAPYVVL